MLFKIKKIPLSCAFPRLLAFSNIFVVTIMPSSMHVEMHLPVRHCHHDPTSDLPKFCSFLCLASWVIFQAFLATKGWIITHLFPGHLSSRNDLPLWTCAPEIFTIKTKQMNAIVLPADKWLYMELINQQRFCETLLPEGNFQKVHTGNDIPAIDQKFRIRWNVWFFSYSSGKYSTLHRKKLCFRIRISEDVQMLKSSG